MNSTRTRLVAATFVALAQWALVQGAAAQTPERSGKEVVEAVCASCHATGANGSPKIGDKNAWGKRAAQGLSSLTANALKGIRSMPSHGGKLELTDLEIGRAVAYMVNMSGGKWKEPASAKDMAIERSGKQVVDAQCSTCHAKGEGGAPRIGDRQAWAPRLKQGMDALVLSGIRGHGGMPPRGGAAEYTDGEIRAAINYMFNPASATAKSAPKAAPAAPDRMHKLVEGTDVYLGVLSAAAMRTRQTGADGKTQEIPKGKGYYYVSVVLRDGGTKADIRDAQVEARVANLMTGDTRKLEPITGGEAASYGNYFRMLDKGPYTITLQVRLPGATKSLETKFDYKR